MKIVILIGLLVVVLVLSGCTQQIDTPPPTTKVCEDGTIVEISEQCPELTPETPEQIEFCNNYKSKVKILKEKSCKNCNYGVSPYDHPHEYVVYT